MAPIKRLLFNFRGESVELLTATPENSTDLQDIKDMIRLEYQRRGYISKELASFEDEYEKSSIYFGAYANGALIAAARLIESEVLPTESAFYKFPMPEPLLNCPRDLLREVSRLTVRKTDKNILPRHLVSTTMISSLIDYGFMEGLCGGVSSIKMWFLRLFNRLNLPVLHEIMNAELVYPRDAVLSRFFYNEEDPAVPIYYLHDEAKAIFDGLFRNVARTGKTLLDEPIELISHQVMV